MQSILQYRRMGRHVQQRLDSQKATRPKFKLEHDLESQPELILHDVPPASASSHEPSELKHKSPSTNEPPSSNNTDVIEVSFEANDSENPQNWSRSRKLMIMTLVVGAGISGGWASANDSLIITRAAADFGVSNVTESLSTGVYLIAFGVGSLVSGPFSETLGRTPVYLATLVGFMIFIMASALAPNIGAQLGFRFIAGLVGCTAVTTFAGSTADLWGPEDRPWVFTVFSAMNFISVFTSPVVSGYIGASSSVSWRWTEWIALLISAVVTIFIALFVPETYAPIILSWKASHLRRLTKDQRYRSSLEIASRSLGARLINSIRRPFEMLQHAAVVFFSVYLTVLYTITFTFLTGYTFIHGDIYGFSNGSVGLSFIGLDVGILLAVLIGIPIKRRLDANLRAAKARGETSGPPGEKLWFAIITAPCLPVGLFWMAWTAYRSIPYWSSLGGSVLVGVTFLGVFISSYLYLIDMFGPLAASALAFTTFARYLVAGGLIPASIPMYENLGVHWSLTLLACVSLLLTPVPFAFLVWERRKRAALMGSRFERRS